jgi:hypothetical protein
MGGFHQSVLLVYFDLKEFKKVANAVAGANVTTHGGVRSLVSKFRKTKDIKLFIYELARSFRLFLICHQIALSRTFAQVYHSS